MADRGAAGALNFLGTAGIAPEAYRRLKWLPGLLLAGGLLTTAAQVWQVRTHDRELVRARFESRARFVADALNSRLVANEQVLRGVAGLFVASEFVEQEEFQRYVGSLRLAGGLKGMHGVGYAAARPGGGVAAEHFARLDSAHETDTTADVKEDVTADLLADPRALAALARAGATGSSALSATMGAPRSPAGAGDTLAWVFLPVHRGDRAVLSGWAYARVHPGETISALVSGQMQGIEGQSEISLRDDSASGPGRLLYRTAGKAPDDALVESLRHEQVISYGGRSWTLSMVPTRAWVDSLSSGSIPGMVGFGLIASVLLALGAGYLLALLSRMHGALRETLLSHQVFEVSPDAILVTDDKNRIVRVNPAFERITGYRFADVAGKDPGMLKAGQRPPEFYQGMWRQLQETGLWQGELWNRRKTGELFIEATTISAVQDANGRVASYVAIFRDTTSQRELENRTHYLAHYDQLTGLPNRAFFVERVKHALSMAKRYERQLGLLFIDLNKFKPINDTHGHDAGDIVLREVAARLMEETRESDAACRQGGDEFLVLVPELERAGQLVDLAEKLTESIEAPIEFAGHSLAVSASIGVALFPADGVAADELIAAADAAMYAAKGTPGGHVHLAAGVQSALAGEASAEHVLPR